LAFTGKQKAAMLLMSLDAATAAELVRGLDADVARELALELAGLDADDVNRGGNSTKIIKQFHKSLKADDKFQFDGFLSELLKSTIGRDTTEQIRILIQQVLCNPDLVTCSEEHLKELAVILGGFEKEIQGGLLSAIYSKDHRVAEMLTELMRKVEIDS
jgi:flagellar motor switch protein FliG